MPFPKTPLSPPIVLSFAASDPSGGAGIQADLMTISSMGCHALSVITALTVQHIDFVNDTTLVDARFRVPATGRMTLAPELLTTGSVR